MRILAIRGANLASLEGAFEVPLDDGPLARAGVFAICGPTGAGKSTLLDAMCLALFDSVPRLAGGRRARYGRPEEEGGDRLTVADPRSLLRRGAGRGYAEVDFRGVDGRDYRARWEVRRARHRADGRLQPSAMSLRDLAEDRLVGHLKTEVRSEVEARLGLTFDQFRRSVLLAQGDFATFLEADAKSRADLLERMTGTEIYGRISAEAFARAGRERRSLQVRIAERDAIPVLSDEARAALEGRVPGLELAAAEADLAHRNAAEAVRWYGVLSGLTQEERQAEEALAQLRRQLALAETRRRELEAIEAAQPLRPALEAAEQARAAARRAAEAHDAAATRVKAAGVALAEAEDRARAAALTLEAARASEREAQPTLEAVRDLERDLARERRLLAAATTAADRATRARREVEAQADGPARELSSARAAAEAAARGLEERSAVAELGRRWARLGPVLESVLEAVGEARAAAADEGRGAAGLLAARAARREAEARASTLRSGVDAAERCVRAAREAAEERPSAALIEVRSRWVERRSALETLVEVADRAGMADAAERRHREAAREHGDRREAAQTRAAQAGAARAELAARLEEAETLRDRVRATIDLSARRAELVDGEPCPLCGASEHPYRHEAPALAELDRAQRTRLAELRDEAAALDGALASARTEAGAEARAAAAATDEAERWAARLGEARARWKETAALVGTEGEAWPEELPARSASPRAPEGGAPDWGPLFRLVEVTPSPAEGQPDAMLDPGAREGLARATREAVERIGEIEAEEQRRRAREGAAAEARDALEEARRELAAAEAALHRAREEQSRAEAARDGAHERGRRAEAAVTRGLGVLDPVLASVPGWRERWTVEPERCAASVARAAEAWRQLDEQRTQALERARAVEPRVAAAQAALDRARAEEGRLRGERQAHEDRAQELAEARAAHWGGRPVREVAEELAARVEGARAAREAALGRAAEARASVGEARALAAHRGEARAAASTGRAEADAALEAALAAVGLEEAEVRRRLAHEGTHLETWRQELEALDRRRRDAVAVLQERRRRREAHEAGEGPDGMPRPRVGAADAAGALAEARRRVDEARARWTEARSDLARDDADRARRGHVARDVARQKGDLAVWESLADLIGSANGGKLRVFAQSVTLELLLDHANHHLRDLAPRYRLERVPGEDLALQVVDREMGDEARAVQSLSGGESFLVALGMALGLASLSSDRAHVESLFIDEGFGTLDPASLEVVLATLDTLRSTGRQVGVISHVQTVAERFGTRVEVVAAGPARSRVELVEGP